MNTKMHSCSDGWVIINIGHPSNGSKYIVENSFRQKRADAIREFVRESGNSWDYWKRKFNFRVVRANSIISTQILVINEK